MFRIHPNRITGIGLPLNRVRPPNVPPRGHRNRGPGALVDDDVLHRLAAAQAQRLVAAGVQGVALLALSDEGAPAYDRGLAARLAALGVPAFACTPDLFPDMMAAAIRKQDLNAWAAGAGIAAVLAAHDG